MKITFFTSMAAVLLLGTAFMLTRIRVGFQENIRLARAEEDE